MTAVLPASPVSLPDSAYVPTMDTITQHMAPSRFNYIKFCYQAVTDAIECELDVHYNDPGSVQLVVNITSRPFADAQALYALGHRHFAEYNAYELIKMSSMVSCLQVTLAVATSPPHPALFGPLSFFFGSPKWGGL